MGTLKTTFAQCLPPVGITALSVLLLLPLLLLLPATTGLAQKKEAAVSDDAIKIEVQPQARTTIFHKVIILPFLDKDHQPNAMLTQAFYQALQQGRKYSLLPADVGMQWYEKYMTADHSPGEDKIAIRAGQALSARGVITGKTTLVKANGPLHTSPETTAMLCSYLVSMTDAQTKNKVWSLSFRSTPDATGTGCDTPGLREVLDQAIHRLMNELVRHGDIFSPLLPAPRVLSTQGEIRKIRIVLQPDPPHVYSAYQLLRADSPEGVFHTVDRPVINDRAPLILKDDHLKDATTYYYTIIGRTADNMANVPALPFAITTTGPPQPIIRLHASGNGLRYIRLFWEPSQDPTVNGYVIYRSTARSGPYKKIAVVDGHEKQTYVDFGQAKGFSRYGKLKDNTLYFYIVRAKNFVDVESADSKIVSAITKGAPPPPTGLRAIDNRPRQVPLAWTASPDPDVKGYAIFRSREKRGPFTQIDYVSGRLRQEYVDQGAWSQPLADNTRYYYWLQAVNVVDVNSENSATVSATTKAVPVAVKGIKASNNLYRSVQLEWQPNPEPDITRYEIFRGTIEDNTTLKVGTVPAQGTRFTDTYLRDGSIYWYRIRAIDVDGLEGELSPVVQATTKPVPVQPTGLTARLTKTGIQLIWRENPEDDIVRYEIVTAGFLATKIGQSSEPSFIYQAEFEPGQVYRFQVRAVDSDGLKSPYSTPVSIRIPAVKKSK